MTASPPRPVWLRWPGLAVAAALALAWRGSGGDLGALFAPGARASMAAVARGFLPPAHGAAFLAFLARPLAETVAIAFLGIALALLLALPLSFAAASPGLLAAPGRRPGLARRAAWAASRSALDVMRSIPELVWALVLVRAVGMGPAAGVAAIGVGYAGVLGKVLAEIWESAPRAPAEALVAAGATPLRAFALATVPASLPVATSYVLYRLDCALRASAVLGLVGAGGVGMQLELSLKMMAYDEVATEVLALFALVALVDLASAALRRRIRASAGLLPSGAGSLPARGAALAAAVALAAGAAAFLRLPVGDLASGAPLRALAGYFASSFPPDLAPPFVRSLAPAMLETLAVSVLGTAIAAALGLVLAYPAALRLHASAESAAAPRPARAAGLAAFAWTARGAMNLARTLPELLWALLLVLAVGLGPFAGALALGIHTAGVLGRLYSEALEEVAPGPVAALRAGGASDAAATVLGALPQALPQLVAYTLYRWEVNVRAAAVLGIVGAGGLGQQLHVSLALFQRHRTLTLLLVILALVVAVDLASGALRKRLVEGAPAPEQGRAAPAVPAAADAW